MRNVTRLAPLLALMIGCSAAKEEPPKRVVKRPTQASVAGVVTLQGEDGKVHIIDIPGRYDTSRCLVHVNARGSTMVCLQQTESFPIEYER